MLGKVLQSLSITYEEAEDGVQAVEKMQMSLGSPSTPSTPILKGERERERERRSFDLILVSISLHFLSFYSLVLTISCNFDDLLSHTSTTSHLIFIKKFYVLLTLIIIFVLSYFIIISATTSCRICVDPKQLK